MKLRILTWNLWHGLNPYEPLLMSPMQSGPEHRERYRLQLEVLSAWRRSPNEVLCLQEVNPLARRFDELCTGLAREGAACLVNAGLKLGGLGVPRGLQEGLAIIAGDGVDSLAFEETTLSGRALEVRAPGGAPFFTFQTKERRKALLLEGELEGLKIAVVNLHLHHGPDTGAENLRRKKNELVHLREWLEPRLPEWDLVAVCGDFNCEADSSCLEPLQAMGFTDSATLAGIAQAPTWAPGENPFAAESARLADRPETRAWDGAPHVFDRVYLKSRQPVRVTAHGAIREPGLSDHFGVWVEVTT